VFQMLSRAISDSLRVFDAGFQAISLTILGAVVTALIVFFVRGWEKLKQHVVENILIVFGGAVATWLLVFVVILVRLPAKMLKESDTNLARVIQEKQQFSETINSLIAANKTAPPRSLAPKNEPLGISNKPVTFPTASPQTLPQKNHLSGGDRTALTNALLEFSEVLDEGNEIFGQANTEGANIGQTWRSGTIVQDFQTHKDALRKIDESAKKLAKSFPVVRNKWRLYQEQVDYIFGDNPDNEGPNALINAVEGYSNNIDRWLKIQNREQRAILDLFNDQQREFQSFLSTFSRLWQGSNRRLAEIKKSIE
jgi:hypothetical protein